jgi:integrase
LTPRPEPYPGREPGELDFATPDQIITMRNGVMVGTRPNRQSYTVITPPTKLTWEAIDKAVAETLVPAKATGDDAILQTYLDYKGVPKYPRREAENTWAMFRQLTGHKPLAKCGWDDGKLLVAHYAAKGLKSASIHKRLVRLNAAVRFAIKTGKLPTTMINPFSAVVSDVGKDAVEKVRLDDADIAACRQNLDKLRAEDQLLFRFLCSTGARLGEAFQVVDEESAMGVRFCEVGTKTKASHRRIPFPDCLIPYLPPVIAGRLFKDDPGAAGKRLNQWLHDDCGINERDPQTGEYIKTAHSLRHRAIELLDEAEIPDNVSRRLFGHTKDPHDRYSKAIVVLKKWVDKIDGI